MSNNEKGAQAGSIHSLADSIFGFEPQFNDKIVSLLSRDKGGKSSLTRSQIKVLVLLHRSPGRTATELGEATDMTKASLTGILDALESLGLAMRQARSGDRRKLRVSLTDEGRRFCEGKMMEFDEKLEVRMSPLSGAERASLARHFAGAAAILKKL